MKKRLCKCIVEDRLCSVLLTLLSYYRNFWSILKAMHPKMQRKLLMFVTGSDRIPATGATQMHLKITCGNNGDSDRLPSAHTCFNQLILYKYHTKQKLEKMLITAIQESQGFYVK